MDCLIADTSLLAYLPAASFAIAAGGLGIRFLFPAGPARQHLVAAVLIFLVLASAIAWRQQQDCRRQISEVAKEIVRLLGNDKRTYDEIVAGLRNQVYYKTNAALELLVREERVGTEVATIVDRDSAKTFRVTVYYVRTF